MFGTGGSRFPLTRKLPALPTQAARHQVRYYRKMEEPEGKFEKLGFNKVIAEYPEDKRGIINEVLRYLINDQDTRRVTNRLLLHAGSQKKGSEGISRTISKMINIYRMEADRTRSEKNRRSLKRRRRRTRRK